MMYEHCPSSIRTLVKGNNVEVKYFKTHKGHYNEVQFLPIPRKVQETIAVKSGVPPNIVIGQLRDEFDYTLQKKNLVADNYKLHDIDALSVDLQVKRFFENSSNPIIMYKTQETENFPLDINNSMLVILTEIQIKVLKKFSSGKLCIDSTHGTNQYNFNLTTIIVEVVGCLGSSVFMTNDAPAFWNEWTKTMSPSPKFHLLCKWHIDNNWRKNLKKIAGPQTVEAYVYKTLRVLLEEPDVTQFEKLLNLFLGKLEEEPTLHSFKTYFLSHYVHRKQLWAACYRHEAMLNTNMVLEAFHKTLKYEYLKGEKNQRLDILLWNLLKTVRDKNFERLVKLCNGGKATHYVNAINSHHRSAVQIHNCKINRILDITWTVISETSNKTYLVKKRESCECKIICVACKVRVHLFSCTYYDYTIKNNLCKHIHVVKINMSDDNDLKAKNDYTNPIDTDEMCMKISDMQQIIAPSVVSIANKIQQFHSMFVSAESNVPVSLAVSLNENASQEPANKNVKKQLPFFSTKKLRLKLPEEQRLNKPTLNVKKQIIDDLNEKDGTPYVHIDSQCYNLLKVENATIKKLIFEGYSFSIHRKSEKKYLALHGVQK
ncbi:SWIM-type domain-containing protein [Aphis craccivora]|uniref:SWIM-type domain-containing protein n=1 Tax=Aphis craccivora TaxID=307492 RepID=A0A6G0YE76_APHCR|nr:SWIM-type domain-containing protein [Aphis craccivora]